MDLCSQVFDASDILVAREYVRVCLLMYICVCIYMHVHNRSLVWTCVVNSLTYVKDLEHFLPVSMYVYVYVQTCVCVYINTHIHAQ